jgi:outer membrane protein
MHTYLILPFFITLPWLLAAQRMDTVPLNLIQAVELAHSDAPDVAIARTMYSNQYWRYQSFLANYRPAINFGATLPNLNRSIQAITLPDGRDAFISRSLMSNGAGISLQQGVAATGGRIFARSNIERIDIFRTGDKPGFVSYLSTPISFGFEQPIFGFNRLKWERRTEPLRFEESKKRYSEQLADNAYRATELFFEVLMAQINLEAARKDKIDADTLLVISRGRFEVGRIALDELLQIELSAMNAEAAIAQHSLTMQTQTERLRDFLGIRSAVVFQLIAPSDIPVFQIDGHKALLQARLNRGDALAFERRLTEAQMDVAQARAERGINMNLFGSFGLSQTGPDLESAYTRPLDQEQVVLGINIPIADWGRARANLEIARSNQELVQMQVAQDRINFEREVLIRVQQFDLVRRQVQLAMQAHDVSKRRLEMSRNRYLIGKILITDLNLALREEAEARRGYIAALRNFWLAYYDLRRLTLYDFETDRSLTETPD